MFRKILIANRGEIAVRIIRTCHELGIETVAVYEPPDSGSLHVRLATEAVRLPTALGFRDAEAIVHLAVVRGAEAIHPGYGFLAEEAHFIRLCEAAGLAFIGPPVAVVEAVRNKLSALQCVQAAGFPTVTHSTQAFEIDDDSALQTEAEQLGYPLVIKSCSGGRGRGERLVRSPEKLNAALRRAQAEAHAVYGSQRVYLERAILPAQQIGVQVVGDSHGHLVHLGEREGSLIYGHQKVLEETPSPNLTSTQRECVCEMALALARLFNYQNVGTVEFLVDSAGQFFFSEIKARIQMEHPVTEMVTRLDLVREQIRLAAGESLGYTQTDIRPQGWAMQCRVNAEDPWHNLMPAPGELQHLRLPSGAETRVDTYVYSGCAVPVNYDPLIAKLIVWGPERATCITRLRQALNELVLIGTPTNLPLLQQLTHDSNFQHGQYTTDLLRWPIATPSLPDQYFRDLAVMMALVYQRRAQAFQPARPERLRNGWHREAHRLPR